MLGKFVIFSLACGHCGRAVDDDTDSMSLLAQRHRVQQHREILELEPSQMQPSPIHTKSFRDRNAFRIACPVIASLYKRNILNPDEMGRIKKSELLSGLEWMGNSHEASTFQAKGIASYEEDDLLQKKRSRVEAERWLNIFLMNPGELVSDHQLQHGISTNIRDTRFDDPWSMESTKKLPMVDLLTLSNYSFEPTLKDATPEEAARIRKIREERFHYWFDDVLEDGKFDAKGLAKLICKLRTRGDHSGEWSKENQERYYPGMAETPFMQNAQSQWQVTLAMSAFVAGTGRQDTKDGPLYLTLEDLKQFYLDSEFPFDPPKRKFSFMPNDLGIGASLHNTCPELVYSKLIDEDVLHAGDWWTPGPKTYALRIVKVFNKINCQFATYYALMVKFWTKVTR